MKNAILLLLVFAISCNQRDAIIQTNNLVTNQAPKKDSISGVYQTESDSLADCNIMLRISKKNKKYHYQLKTSLRNIKGKIRFESDSPNSHYLILEGIPWDEYAGDISKELENDEWSGDENDKDNPKDISTLIGKDTLYIQNTGNSMNYYTILRECGNKYIVLIKQR